MTCQPRIRPLRHPAAIDPPGIHLPSVHPPAIRLADAAPGVVRRRFPVWTPVVCLVTFLTACLVLPAFFPVRAAAGPIEVTDAAGNIVTLDKPAARVVVIGAAPFIPLHMVYMFDQARDRLAGFEVRGQVTDEFLELIDPDLSLKQALAANPGPESVAALAPDLVITKSTVEGQAVRTLKALGIPVMHVGAETPGMVLSASGMVFQMIFRNPIVDAGFLGVSGGAAFGASLGIVLLGGSVAAIQGSAALFAVLGLGFSWFMAVRIRFGDWILRLILAGIAVSALFAAGTGLLKYLADPLRELPELTFWLLGGLWGITWTDTLQILALCIPCLTVIWLFRWRLNLLSMQDETIFSLVADASKERIVLLLTAVIATSAVVCKAGQVGWVGLIIPHIARRLVGSDAQKALPCSLLLGGIFLLLCDNASRTLLSGEIPLGILTSFIGAGLFLILLVTRPMLLGKK